MEMRLRARIRAGDPEAFRALFDEGAGVVYAHAYRLAGDRSTAEEIVSLTFLEAWRLRRTIEPDPDNRSLRPWLLGIATNVARNLRRATRRHAAALARLPRALVVPDPAEEVAARLDDRDRLARTKAALAALRPGEREVLALCVWAGLDYAQAAEALDVPVGTVRSRLSRARRRLNRLVESGWEPAVAAGQEADDRDPAVRLAEGNAR
jgi:RNA polymerase sigma-70 factor, ECF subfamily